MADQVDVGGLQAKFHIDTNSAEQNLQKLEMQCADTQAKIDKYRKLIQESGDATGRYAHQIKIHTEYQQELSASYAALNQQIQQNAAVATAAASATEGMASSTEKATKNLKEKGSTAKQVGGFLRQLTYAIDDIGYGLSAVINNIPGLLGPFGLFGVVVAGVAIASYRLWENWDKIRVLMGDKTALEDQMRSLDGLKSRLDEIRKQLETWPSGVKLSEFNELDARHAERAAARKNADDMMEEAKTEAQKKDAKRFEEVVGEAGGLRQIGPMIGEQLYNEGGPEAFLGKDDQERLKEAKDPNSKMGRLKRAGRNLIRGKMNALSDEILRQQDIKDLEEKAKANAQRQGEDLVGAAKDDPQERQRLMGLLQRSGRFPDIIGKIAGPGMTESDKKEDRKKVEALMQEGREGAEEAARQTEAKDKEIKKQEEADAKAEQDDLRKEKERAAKDVEKVKKEMPGIEDLAKSQAASAMLGGRSIAQIKEDFTKSIINQGVLDQDQAGLAAETIVNDAAGEVQKRAIHQGLYESRPKDKNPFKSEIYDASQITAKIQAGVGDPKLDESLTVAKAMERYLADLVRMGKDTFTLKVD